MVGMLCVPSVAQSSASLLLLLLPLQLPLQLPLLLLLLLLLLLQQQQLHPHILMSHVMPQCVLRCMMVMTLQRNRL
jgi:hypothetical protein